MPSMQRRLVRLNLIFQIGFGLVALALAYWGVVRASALLARDDNARRVESELRLQRGAILDSRGQTLAHSVGVGRLERVYPFSFSGPAVGYYSFRHGVAGIEAGLDATLRGDGQSFWAAWRQQLLHQPQQGRSVRLTLDARAQAVGDEALGRHAGALLVLSLPDASILALVSHPSYDPNQIDAQFEALTGDPGAPLLNRATQGQYQPGLMLQPLLVGAGLARGMIQLTAPVADANRPVVAGEVALICQSLLPDPTTWADVVAHQCPAPMLQLADEFGRNGLLQLFNAWGFAAAPELPIEAAEPLPLTIDNPQLAILGQENLTISPLQMALAWAGLVSAEPLPAPRLVASIQDGAGQWQSQPTQGPAVTGGLDSDLTGLAGQVLGPLRSPENLIEQVSLVLSGPNRATNGWYVGASLPRPGPGYLVAVVVEDSRQIEVARDIGRNVLQQLTQGLLSD